MFKGLQWKVVLMYTLLLFFAFQVIGVYLVQSLEHYYFSNYVAGIENQARLLSSLLNNHILEDDREGIVNLIEEFRTQEDTDIMVLDRYSRVIGTSGFTTSGFTEEMDGQRLIKEEVTRALGGSQGDEVRINPENDNRYYYLAYPIEDNGMVNGVVYLSGSLNHIDQTLGEIKGILLTGSLVVLLICASVGVILTRTITRPVEEVTRRAAELARGDFSQRIKVYSEDEIGQLSRMFNYLVHRLRSTLNEMSLEKSKVEAILNYMSDGVVAFDGNGTLIHVNPAAREMLDRVVYYSLNQENPGVQLLENLVGKDKVKEFYHSGEPFTMEVSRETPPVTLEVGVASFKEETGQLKGVLVVLHDVTREREMSRRQREFVANVSHELKTPLTSIKSYTEALLEEDDSNQELRERFLQVIHGETERMVSMVKDLLELSQLDDQSTLLRREKKYLVTIIEDALDKVRPRFAENPAVLVDVDPDLMVEVDRERICQVFINLLNNAFKFTPPEEGWVQVSAEQEGNRVKVAVGDNGKGIPEEEISRVFERFYRVDKTRSRDSGGTGLGLSICKQVIEGHQGNIWMESRAGEGTVVYFTLPAAQ